MWDRMNGKYRRLVRIALVLGTYSVVLSGSLWLAYLLRFEFNIPAGDRVRLEQCLLWMVPVELAVMVVIGQCSGLLSYFSVPDLWRLFLGLFVPSVSFMIAWHMGHFWMLPPRSVILASFIFSFGGLCAIRLAFRFVRERFMSPQGRPRSNARRVGIIGAGDGGAALARELIRKQGLGMQPVMFFDDDPSKWRSQVHGVPVEGAPELLVSDKARLDLDEVVIAMPSAPVKRIKEIVQMLQGAKYKFTTVPSMDQLATGRVSVSHLRPVDIEDLLGRAPVQLEKRNVEQCLSGRVVMVTGAGGSIGSELCRQVAQFKPERLLLLDQSEVQLFQIEQELIELGKGAIIQPLVVDVVDSRRLRQVFAHHCPDVIFHAAAHKHVPMMENQPAEAIKNNTFGTIELAQLAVEYRTERFVMISTDKAINPTSVMGATKRMAELYVQSLASQTHRSRLMAVRFGNVLGSSGSVIPVFKRQIAAGGPVKVTHPDITRYFMTIPEAVSLVLQSAALGDGGEIFVLDMGAPVKIADLAAQLIELSGFKPGEDIEIQYVGLRPGEKLYEELQHNNEDMAPTVHPKIRRFISEPVPLPRLLEQYRILQKALYEADTRELKLLIQRIVPEYVPYMDMSAKQAFAPGAKAKSASSLPVSQMPIAAAGNA